MTNTQQGPDLVAKSKDAVKTGANWLGDQASYLEDKAEGVLGNTGTKIAEVLLGGGLIYGLFNSPGKTIAGFAMAATLLGVLMHHWDNSGMSNSTVSPVYARDDRSNAPPVGPQFASASGPGGQSGYNQPGLPAPGGGAYPQGAGYPGGGFGGGVVVEPAFVFGGGPRGFHHR